MAQLKTELRFYLIKYAIEFWLSLSKNSLVYKKFLKIWMQIVFILLQNKVIILYIF